MFSHTIEKLALTNFLYILLYMAHAIFLYYHLNLHEVYNYNMSNLHISLLNS